MYCSYARRAGALAERLQVAVGVACDEGHVAAAEALDVAVGQLDQRPTDFQPEDVHLNRVRVRVGVRVRGDN